MFCPEAALTDLVVAARQLALLHAALVALMLSTQLGQLTFSMVAGGLLQVLLLMPVCVCMCVCVCARAHVLH